MMKFVCKLTKEYGIKTIVSMNPIMIDGTGMCGGCRLTVGGETKFACVDGPDFDGHLVDFDEAMQRGATYRDLKPTPGKKPATCSPRRYSNMPNMRLDKNPMPAQEPDVRNKNFNEVALGYTEEIALDEAPLPPLQEQPLCLRLPGADSYSRLYRQGGGGRL